MGADCCRPDSQPGPPGSIPIMAEGKNRSSGQMPFEIFGDYFDRDTRALLALCDMAE